MTRSSDKEERNKIKMITKMDPQLSQEKGVVLLVFSGEEQEDRSYCFVYW